MSSLSSTLVIPDSALAKEAAQILREYSTDLLINHSMRVYQREQKCSPAFLMREVFHCRHAYDAIAASPFPDSE